MKLGQVYFRLGDNANAQTQFETLARENPGSNLCESALFLAGQSSMRSLNPEGVDRAIEIFQQVVEAKKSLRLYARQQQAIAYVRLGKEKDAVILDDEILGANPPADLRFAVLGAKGDSLVTIAGKDPQLLNQAIAVFDQLASQPDVTASWRNQALYKKAKCLNTLSRSSEAMAVYYDILQSTSASGPEGPDYTWFYKAGFDAGGALEAQENWKAAIEIYEKLANLLGPRSEEAKKRVDQLRLEHFIWEE
jgi:tetratricopeptide (TPR) repeat protein